jgi:hypothetical protein
MRVLSTATRALTLGLGVAMMAGCRDEIPTVTGPDQFPAALSPTTIELVLPATDFLSGGTVFDAFTRPAGLGYLHGRGSVRRRAHRPLPRPADPLPGHRGLHGRPATVRTETDFQYVGGRMLATVDAAGLERPRPRHAPPLDGGRRRGTPRPRPGPARWTCAGNRVALADPRRDARGAAGDRDLGAGRHGGRR